MKKFTIILTVLITLSITANAQTFWSQIGSDIDGEAAEDRSGSSVSLSSDGSVLAIGAWLNDGNGESAGHVRIYQNNAGVWTQVGNDIDGEATGDGSGFSVNLSSDGSVLAIGADGNNGNGPAAGHVRVYENQSGTWTQIGSDIDGEAAEDMSGVSVNLSSDGSVVAIGAWLNDGNGTAAGHVRVYENQSGTWTQIGSDIDGEAADDMSGISVNLSSDGSIVAIGAYGNDGNGTDAGHVRVYENQSGTWTQIGSDIDGEEVIDHSGYSVSLNSDGSIVAIGAIDNDGNGTDAGHVRIYDFCGTTSSITELACDSYTSPSGNYIWTSSGNYIDDTIPNVAGCDSIITIDLTVNYSVSISTQPTDKNICLGNSVTFSINSVGTSLSFQWQKSGVDISGANTSSFTIPSVSLLDEGMYTCQISNTCNTVTSTQAELKVIELTASTGIADNICTGNSTQLQATATTNHTAESGTINYSWSPSSSLDNANIENPNASPTITTNYAVIVTDQIGCTATDDIDVFVQNAYQNQQLCLVTVDTTANKNKIIWEGNNSVGTENYLIQKEIATNIYSTIGVVAATAPHEFIDNASDPEAHSDLYKILIIDTCGNQSNIDSCAYHKTINLVISANGSTMGLNWEEYEVEDGSYIPSQYYIYRGTSSNNLALLDSVTGSIHSYNDLGITSVFYYMIGVKRNGCGGAKSTYTAFSNKKDNTGMIGINSGMAYIPLSIYPNPTTGKIRVEAEEVQSIEVINLQGKQIYKTEVGNRKTEVDLSHQAKGIYIIKLTTNKCVVVEKIVLE